MFMRYDLSYYGRLDMKRFVWKGTKGGYHLLCGWRVLGCAA